MSNLITLFARKEPTTDEIAVSKGQLFRRDVVFYRDEQCTQFFARWPWYLNPPRKTKESITLNSWVWALSWLPDADVDAELLKAA